MTLTNKLIALLAVFFCFAACPSYAAKSKKAELNQAPAIPKDQAQIVLMRSSSFLGLTRAVVYDVTSGEPKAIGKMFNNRKLVLNLPPGDYVLMTGSPLFFDFLKASVSPNKRYYVVVVPRQPGTFSMRPVRHEGSQFLYSSKEIRKMVSDTKLPSRASEALDEGDAKDAGSERVKAYFKLRWEKWQAMPPDQKDIETLRPDDSEEIAQ